jgi:hypothetical protein
MVAAGMMPTFRSETQVGGAIIRSLSAFLARPRFFASPLGVPVNSEWKSGAAEGCSEMRMTFQSLSHSVHLRGARRLSDF